MANNIDLSPYRAIQTGLFVRLDIPDYEVLRFSNYNQVISINGESYAALGTLLGVTESAADLRAAAGEVSITISGIPNSSITDIIDLKIKGSSIEVYRAIFNANSSQPLLIPGNPMGRFQGIVTNFSIQEDYDSQNQQASNSILFTCCSVVEFISNKISGRRTNPIDEHKFYPTDTSMDRVLKLANANLNFGAV